MINVASRILIGSDQTDGGNTSGRFTHCSACGNPVVRDAMTGAIRDHACPASVARVVSYRSSNAKTGPIPTTSGPQSTCPTTCPLYGQGCYAENRPGRPSIFDMVDKSARRVTVRSIATRRWRKLPPAVRFNVSGDYLDAAGRIDYQYIADTNMVAEALAPSGTVTWSYSHAWRALEPSMFSYVVRASCQSAEEASDALARGWDVAIVDPGPQCPDTLIGSTIDGRKVVQCPVTTGRVATCSDCRLCGRAGSAIVAFPVHGSSRRRAAVAVRTARADDAMI